MSTIQHWTDLVEDLWKANNTETPAHSCWNPHSPWLGTKLGLTEEPGYQTPCYGSRLGGNLQHNGQSMKYVWGTWNVRLQRGFKNVCCFKRFQPPPPNTCPAIIIDHSLTIIAYVFSSMLLTIIVYAFSL